jgi:hypothetical protein
MGFGYDYEKIGLAAGIKNREKLGKGFFKKSHRLL